MLWFTLPAAALGQDGKLVQASPVVFSDDVLTRLEAAHPAIRALQEKIDVQAITYLSDGLKIKGYLAMPKSAKGLPCVIWNRGGSRFSPGSDINDELAATLLAQFASWGYLVVASQYRGNGDSEGQDEMGGNDVNDVLHLIPLLQWLPQADPTRIGMFGWSRGGMETYIALTRTERINAAIVGGGVADLFDNAARRPIMDRVYSVMIPGFAADREAVLAARSAARWPERLPKSTPLLILQGGADSNTPPGQVLALASALHRAQRPFRLVFFEGGDHGLSEYRTEVNRLSREWLDMYVRDRKPWPSLTPHPPPPEQRLSKEQIEKLFQRQPR